MGGDLEDQSNQYETRSKSYLLVLLPPGLALDVLDVEVHLPLLAVLPILGVLVAVELSLRHGVVLVLGAPARLGVRPDGSAIEASIIDASVIEDSTTEASVVEAPTGSSSSSPESMMEVEVAETVERETGELETVELETGELETVELEMEVLRLLTGPLAVLILMARWMRKKHPAASPQERRTLARTT
jgi:hypothetical protein